VAVVMVIFWVIGAWPFRPVFFPILRRKPAD
jgi:hypothetical protein